MLKRPVQLTEENAVSFDDDDVVDCYAHRPFYNAEIISTLSQLAGGHDAKVLDIGTGIGELSQRLAPFVGRSTPSTFPQG